MTEVLANLEAALAAAPDDATKAKIQALIDDLGGGAHTNSGGIPIHPH